MSLPAPFDTGPVAVRIQRDVIRATGPDTEKFLQGQLSQDLAPLAPGESAWSFLLQPQGKVDAWLRVTRIDAESFLLDLEAGYGASALTRLSRFKLRTACELSSETWDVVSIRGPGAHGVEIPVGSGAEVVARAGWRGVEGIDALGPQVAVPDAMAEATPAQFDMLRIMAGVPAMGSELTENTIPAEAGVVDQSVSFTKGCFTGQELVARIDSRGGNVPRNLRGVVAEADVSVGDAVVVDGKEVGSITSVSGPLALAYIKRSVTELPAPALVGATAASVRTLPLL